MRLTIYKILFVLLFMHADRLHAQSDGTIINFSFDEVDVRTFVKLVGDVTGRKFVVDESVKGRITVISPRVTVEEVYPLFVRILESAGCAIADDGAIARIVPLPDRAGVLSTVIGADGVLPSGGLVTKIFQLKHVPVAQLRKALDAQFGGKSSSIGVVEETNHLIVTDTADRLRAVEQIVAEVDRAGLSRVTEVVPLQYAGSAELADVLNQTLTALPGEADRTRNRMPAIPGVGNETSRRPLVVASPHANCLLLVGSSAEVAELRRLIANMDVDAPAGQGRLNAIFLKHLSADDAAKQLNALFGRVQTGAGQAVPAGTVTGANELGRRVIIEPSPANNALLISAFPGDYEVVRRLVEQLDMTPQQVHIEVVIAEISASDGFRFGIEAASVNQPSRVSDTAIQGSYRLNDNAEGLLNQIQNGIFPSGITVGVAEGTRLDAEGKLTLAFPAIINLDAVRRDTRFHILSETALEAQNNLDASLSIVNDIPILKSTIEGGSGASRDVIQNIERTSVGIKLKLTPHVIPPGDEIRMVLNPVIEAVIDTGLTGDTLTPTIARREVSTTVTVPNGKMIIIAGLTRTDRKMDERRVPILGSIPIIGWLFRHRQESVDKTNLLIFVTPRIVSNPTQSDAVMKEWQQKTEIPVSHDP
ncbi:MAG: type II secretion system protein GspD [Lentisphaerae bacterium RIFOXYC12_FULL_60_16]|nr:MAG: type II secretion system protein GspD [Lentisphaerae bacterium RIFOXYC12_FULL_60_16]OGV74880.1 MAG: type II secretion system protein GspD [Lentisphaerae bacterium RIFOXYA12_FULL_60_10]OGV84382.1 MAG: type II secretion system protein GspD [Lentisphaerae bacterium RIFOXYB12_FULL_60_10]